MQTTTTVIMVAAAAGPEGSLQAKKVYALPTRVAKVMIDAYAAEEIGGVHAEVTRRRKLAKEQEQAEQ